MGQGLPSLAEADMTPRPTAPGQGRRVPASGLVLDFTLQDKSNPYISV